MATSSPSRIRQGNDHAPVNGEDTLAKTVVHLPHAAGDLAQLLSERGSTSKGRCSDITCGTACVARLASPDRFGVASQVVGEVWRLDDGWDADLVRMENDHPRSPSDFERHCRRASDVASSCNRASRSRRSRGTVRALGPRRRAEWQHLRDRRDQGGPAAVRPHAPRDRRDDARRQKVVIVSVVEWWGQVERSAHRRFAQDHGGRPRLGHQRVLQAIPRQQAEGSPAIADLVAVNVRLSERLQRYGLAECRPNECWRVPPDLDRSARSTRAESSRCSSDPGPTTDRAVEAEAMD